MLRVAIADDEVEARDKLRRLLAPHRDMTVVAEARNGRETIRAVQEHRPDLLLLDVKMPGIDGLESLRALAAEGARLPKLIFITAYDEFALEAFEVRALDYVLKPYEPTRFAAALDRAREMTELESRPEASSIESLFAHLAERPSAVHAEPQEKSSSRYVERLAVRSSGRIEFVPVGDVDWIEAYGNYARLHTATGRPLVRVTIRTLVANLDPNAFVRIHRSAIVNVDRIREMRAHNAGDSVITLASGVRLRVSRAYRPTLDERLRGRKS